MMMDLCDTAQKDPIRSIRQYVMCARKDTMTVMTSLYRTICKLR